jgi:hypothetical protein
MSRAMKRRHVHALLALAALAFGACKTRKTGENGGAARPAPPPWRALVEILPAETAWAVVVGDGASFLRNGRALLTRFRGTTLGVFAEELVRMTQHRLGLRELDPWDADAWRAHGIEPARGVALVGDPRERGYLLAGVSDPVKAEALLQTMLRKLDEAASFKKIEGGGTLALKANGKATSAYAFHQGYAILAAPVGEAPEAVALLGNVTRPDARRLIHRPDYAGLGGRSDFSRGLTLLVLGEVVQMLPEEVRGGFASFRGLTLHAEPAQGGATIEAFVSLAPSSAAEVQKLFPGGAGGAHLARYLAPDTLLSVSGRIDLGLALRKLIGLSPELEKAVQATFDRLKRKLDIDVEKELLQNLAGEAAFGIHKVDAAAIPVLFGGGGLREIFAADPIQLTLLLRVRDPAVAGKFLRKMGILADIPPQKVGEVEVFPVPLTRIDAAGEASKTGPALRFSLVGDVLAATLGKGRMEKVLAAVKAQGGGFLAKVADPEARKLIEGAGSAILHVVGPTLTENLREVESALLRKGKLLFSNLVQKVTEVVDRIADVSAGGEAQPDGGRFWLRLRLK